MSTFTLPDLPYAVDALDPYIDARTLEIHHGKHHATYVNNLNAAIENHEQLKSQSIEQILSDLQAVPEDIRTAVQNNGGGHYCHTLFWESMSPNGGGEPTADIKTAIERRFNTFDQFQDLLSTAAISRFGSGYGWLVLNKEGELEVMSTANQDTPLKDEKTPLLVIDVWEHAYYLKYQNRRPEFVTNWWNTVNWDVVNERLLKAQQR
ncbi:superoxide dismutase [Savagea sp. SN6]|uniref:Superoxide dismutase n=1 Tax=Savagea serpentis TaxID=2785297 RepID=A0A8J7G972_9BACL|nr:superoxide dismutase [Savagea serpentis]MBF4501513.1 superoxide dismutase [Savagea serpentis]